MAPTIGIRFCTTSITNLTSSCTKIGRILTVACLTTLTFESKLYLAVREKKDLAGFYQPMLLRRESRRSALC